MSNKYQFYAQMADQTARQLTGSLRAWTGFLSTAARLYKYPYHEQLMIYAQRPEATACAGYDLWNQAMGRYVRRGSHGIALIDTSGDNPKLKYVSNVEVSQEQAQPYPSQGAEPEATSAPVDFTPYKVGDTVYLENTAYEITAVGRLNVELRDPKQTYPVYRSESREQFERNLYRDRRNAPITDFLAADLDKTSGYLRDALTWDGGLLNLKDKGQVSELFRNGTGNAGVASFLAASYGGKSIEMAMPSGDVGILHADIHALDLRVNNQNGPVSVSRTSWENIAPILRAMYQQNRNGFFREPVLPEPEQTYHEEPTAFYPGERNGLPYDIEIRTLRFDEPEHDTPAPTPPTPTAENFRITDNHLGEGGPKEKFRRISRPSPP